MYMFMFMYRTFHMAFSDIGLFNYNVLFTFYM